MSEIDSILFSKEGNRSVLRFTPNELRQQIHQCTVNARTMRTLGDDSAEAYYQWLQKEMEAALQSLQKQRNNTHIHKNTDIESLKSSLDIAEVIGRYISLKKSGYRFLGLCPFHEEKHPSFTVYPETQSWYCFSCNRGGDVINFIMLIENTDFKDAVSILERGIT